jgi:hypothetical protein
MGSRGRSRTRFSTSVTAGADRSLSDSRRAVRGGRLPGRPWHSSCRGAPGGTADSIDGDEEPSGPLWHPLRGNARARDSRVAGRRWQRADERRFYSSCCGTGSWSLARTGNRTRSVVRRRYRSPSPNQWGIPCVPSRMGATRGAPSSRVWAPRRMRQWPAAVMFFSQSEFLPKFSPMTTVSPVRKARSGVCRTRPETRPTCSRSAREPRRPAHRSVTLLMNRVWTPRSRLGGWSLNYLPRSGSRSAMVLARSGKLTPPRSCPRSRRAPYLLAATSTRIGLSFRTSAIGGITLGRLRQQHPPVCSQRTRARSPAGRGPRVAVAP